MVGVVVELEGCHGEEHGGDDAEEAAGACHVCCYAPLIDDWGIGEVFEHNGVGGEFYRVRFLAV